MKYRIYGCYSKDYLKVLAELYMKLGFERTLIMNAEIGMPEFSNVGKTFVVEQNGGDFKEYIVSPEDLGVSDAHPEDIKTGGREQNIEDFVRILKGDEQGPKADLVAINAGAALYALGDVKTIKEGTNKSLQILSSGNAYNVLKKLNTMFGCKTTLT